MGEPDQYCGRRHDSLATLGGLERAGLVTSPTRLRGELLSGDKTRMAEAARAPRLNLAAALRHMTPSERDRVILDMPASEARRYLRPAIEGIEGLHLSERARQKLGLPEP